MGSTSKYSPFLSSLLTLMAKKKETKAAEAFGAGDLTPEEELEQWTKDLSEIASETNTKVYSLGTESSFEMTHPMSTGIAGLDAILGGGLFSGRFYEVFGEESHGKSTLTYSMMSSFQKAGGYVYLVESESAIDIDRAQMLGVDTEDRMNMTITSPPSFEDAINGIAKITSKFSERFPERPLLIVWDTIATVATRAEIENINSGKFMGAGISERARAFSLWLKAVDQLISGRKIYLVLVNQVRDKIGGGWQPPGASTYDSNGGRALKHAWTARIHVRKSTKLEDGTRLIGHEVSFTLEKSKSSPEKLRIKSHHYFNSGFDSSSSVVDLCLNVVHGVLEKKSNGMTNVDGLEKTFRSSEALAVEIRNQPSRALHDYILRRAYLKLAEIYPTLTNRINNTILPTLADPTPEQALEGIA